jgi:hypothetical protein
MPPFSVHFPGKSMARLHDGFRIGSCHKWPPKFSHSEAAQISCGIIFHWHSPGTSFAIWVHLGTGITGGMPRRATLFYGVRAAVWAKALW